MKRSGTLVAGLVLAAAMGAGCVIVADGPPAHYRYIGGTPIRVVHVPGIAGDVFYCRGYYYRYHAGMWSRSRSRAGSWLATSAVPTAFLSIPPSHPSYYIVQHHPRYRKPVLVHKPRRPLPPRPGVIVRPPRPGHPGHPTQPAHPTHPHGNRPGLNRPANAPGSAHTPRPRPRPNGKPSVNSAHNRPAPRPAARPAVHRTAKAPKNKKR